MSLRLSFRSVAFSPLGLLILLSLIPGRSSAQLTKTAVEIQKVVPGNAAAGDFIGPWDGVAISGDWAVVGGPGHGVGGAAWVLYRDQGGTDNWGVVKTLTPSDGSGSTAGAAWSAGRRAKGPALGRRPMGGSALGPQGVSSPLRVGRLMAVLSGLEPT